jgi:hypothetical protein
MSTIVTRAGKGSPLTNAEVDANFVNLNTDKYQSGDTASFASLALTTTPLGVSSGGSGATTAQAAINTFAGAVTSGLYLRGNGTNVVMAAIQATDVPTLNQNTTGNAATATSIAGGTANQIPYQSAAGTTAFITAPTVTSTVLSWDGTAFTWATGGGGGSSAISNDTTTATNLYPLFANATSGTASTIFTGNAKLLYKPSTGELSSTAMVSTNGITMNNTTVAASCTIISGSNGMSAGPVVIADGVSVTVPSGSVWTIV